MRTLSWLALLLLLGGCSTAAPVRTGAPDPWPGEQGLLVHRTMLCEADDTDRRLRLAAHDAQGHRQQLERLMWLSCDPYVHRDALGLALRAADLTPGWSAEERAFLAFLTSHHQALERLEAQRLMLEQQLEDTIRGISAIEEAIDGRPESSPYEQEDRP